MKKLVVIGIGLVGLGIGVVIGHWLRVGTPEPVAETRVCIIKDPQSKEISLIQQRLKALDDWAWAVSQQMNVLPPRPFGPDGKLME